MPLSLTCTRIGTTANYEKFLTDQKQKTDLVNSPDLLDFTLVSCEDSTFVKLRRGDYIKFQTNTYGLWFTGYITNTPDPEPLGEKNGQEFWKFRYQASSDDVVLNQNALGYIQTYYNTTQGAILRDLVTRIAPSLFDISGIQDGHTVAKYKVDPSKKFGQIAKEFGDLAYYQFSAKDHKLYYQPQATSSAGIIIDGNDKYFTPADLQIRPNPSNITNDVTVFGEVEPQDYMNEYFLGDGFLAEFDLISSVFGLQRSVYIDETFGSLDENKWTVVDPAGTIIQVANGLLQCLGGSNNGSMDTYIISVLPIPLQGTLRETHGEWDFIQASSGIIAGLWTQTPNAALTGCIYGLKLSKSGSDTIINPIVRGVVDTSQLFTISDYTKRYVMRTIISFQLVNRQVTQYTYRNVDGTISTYGGDSFTDLPIYSTLITQIDPLTGTTVATCGFYNADVTPLSSSTLSAYYAPMVADDLHATVTSITLSTALQAWLETQDGVDLAFSTTAWVPKIIGPNEIDAQDGLAPVATIIDAASGVQDQTDIRSTHHNPGHAKLEFFKANYIPSSTVIGVTNDPNYVSVIPKKSTLIHLKYRMAGVAASRVEDPASIAAEAALWGDTGVRSLVENDTTLKPATSSECESLAGAILKESLYQHYEGTYTFPSIFSFTSEPKAGTILHFQNLSSIAFPDIQAEVVTEVKSTLLAKFPREILQHEITFGEADSIHKVMSRVKTPVGSFAAQDSAEVPLVVPVTIVGSAHADDVTTPTLTGWDATTLTFNTNQAAPSGGGFEIRYTDEGWGTSDGKNLVTRTGTQTYTVPRTARGRITYIRAFDAGGKYSRFSACLRVAFPLKPSAPVYVSEDLSDKLHPAFTFIISGNIPDVYGIEARDAENNALVMSRAVMAPSDLTFVFNNSAVRSRNSTFNVYFFNLLGEYSDPTQVSFDFIMPMINNLHEEVPTKLVLWDLAQGFPSGYRVKVTSDISTPTAQQETVVAHPSVLLNGWSQFTHMAPYEKTTTSGSSADFDGNLWGYNRENTGIGGYDTLSFVNPDYAVDGDLSTKAYGYIQHGHGYDGVIYAFGGSIPAGTSRTLNVTAEVPADGQDGYVISGNRAGIWYTLDGGATWTKLFYSSTRSKQTYRIPLPDSQNYANVQVMGFVDGHDDMVLYIYDVAIYQQPGGNVAIRVPLILTPGILPEAFAISPDGKYLYGTYTDGNTKAWVYRINTATFTVEAERDITAEVNDLTITGFWNTLRVPCWADDQGYFYFQYAVGASGPLYKYNGATLTKVARIDNITAYSAVGHIFTTSGKRYLGILSCSNSQNDIHVISIDGAALSVYGSSFSYNGSTVVPKGLTADGLGNIWTVGTGTSNENWLTNLIISGDPSTWAPTYNDISAYCGGTGSAITYNPADNSLIVLQTAGGSPTTSFPITEGLVKVPLPGQAISQFYSGTMSAWYVAAFDQGIQNNTLVLSSTTAINVFNCTTLTRTESVNILGFVDASGNPMLDVPLEGSAYDITHDYAWFVAPSQSGGTHGYDVFPMNTTAAVLNPTTVINIYTIDHPHNDPTVQNAIIIQQFQLTYWDFQPDLQVCVTPFDQVGDGPEVCLLLTGGQSTSTTGGFYVNGTGAATGGTTGGTGSTGGTGGTSGSPTVIPDSMQALIAPNGSQFADYKATSTNSLVAHNFATLTSFSDKSSNEQSSNVSRESIKNLLYSGATTGAYAATLDWWRSDGHDAGVSTGYVSNDSTQQMKQAQEFKARGFDGSFPTWYGTGTTMNGDYHGSLDGINQAMLKGLAAFESLGGLKMFLMMDHLAFSTELGIYDPTTQIKQYLAYWNTHYASSSAYLKVGGRPLFGFFGENLISGINWSSINSYGASLSNGHPIWVIRNDQAWSKGLSDSDMATFGWPEAGEAVSTYLTRFYSHAAAHPSTLCIGTAFKGFNDALADWGKGRIITQNNGQIWLDCFTEINSLFSSSNQLSLMTVDTWTDYEEGTEVETGINSSLVINVTLSTTTLNWTVSGGNESAHARYEIYASPDGTKVQYLGFVAIGSPRTFSLSGLSAGTWTVIVYGVGKSCVRNVISNTVNITV